jgi:hypothetical protein
MKKERAMRKKRFSAPVGTNLEPDTRKKLEQRAARDRRTISEYVRLLIERDVQAARK